MQKQSYEAINLNRVNPEIRHYLLLTILTMMSIAGLIGSDVYLPALPTIGLYFHQTNQMMQITLGIYLFGLSVSQLIYGPLSDKFGRKIPVNVGIILYFLSSIVCTVTDNFHLFLMARFLQGVGACAGLTIGRAIIGDLFDAKQSAKVFSTIFPFVGMSPAISPVIGGFLITWAGWRSTFIFIVLFSFILSLMILFLLKETIADEHKQKSTIHPIKLFRNYIAMLINLKFLTYALIPCFAYIAYFGYIADSPFIFHKHGYIAHAIGCFYITLSITYVLGNLTGKKCLNYLTLNQSLLIGYSIFSLGGLLVLIAGLQSNFNLIFMISSISVLTFGNGFLIPQGSAGVVSNFQYNRGMASGMLGFLQLGMAAISASLVGKLCNTSLLSLGIYLFIISICGPIIFLILLKLNNKLR